MDRSDARFNLLFGLLALRQGLIDEATLVEAHFLWLNDGRGIDQVLLERGAINAAAHAGLTSEATTELARGSAASGGEATTEASDTTGDAPPRGPVESTVRDPTETPRLSTTTGTDDDGDDRRSDDCGRYRDLRFHARGGMGVVFMARDVELGRDVAVKRNRRERADSRPDQARLWREAEITGRLEHPGVVPVYGLGRNADDRPYYAMKFVGGVGFDKAIAAYHKGEGIGASPAARPSLASTVSQTGPGGDTEPRGTGTLDGGGVGFTVVNDGGPRPVLSRGERALALRRLLRRFLDLCNTIDYAHSRGVLHRDLKPSNVRLGEFGETIVLDWGLAKHRGSAEDGVGSRLLAATIGDRELPLTDPETPLGTIGYMSPEQARGDFKAVGVPSDVYGLGAVLYQLLTGRPTIGSVRKEVGIVRTLQGDFPRPREVKADVPAALESVCLTALKLAPEGRYADVRGLIDDVERWLEDQPVSVHHEGPAERLSRLSRRHRSWTRAAAAAVAAVAVISTGAAVRLDRSFRSEQRALAASKSALQEAETSLNVANAERARAEQARTQAELARASETTAFGKANEAYAALEDELSGILITADEQLAHLPESEPVRTRMLGDALTGLQSWLRRNPTLGSVRRQAADAYHRKANLHQILGELGEALEHYAKGLTLYAGLASEFPEYPPYRIWVAELEVDFGQALVLANRPEDALIHFRDAVSLADKLCDEHPKADETNRQADFVRRVLARTQNALADGLLQVGEVGEALELNEKSVGYLQTDAGQPLPLIVSLIGQATAALEAGQRGVAEAALDSAVGKLGPLRVANPKDNNFKALLAYARSRQGGLLAAEPLRSAEADRAFDDALKLWTELRDDHPLIRFYSLELAAAYNGRGGIRADSCDGPLDEVEADCGKAQEVLEKLAPTTPPTDDTAGPLAQVFETRARIARARCRLAEERGHLGRAIGHQKRALKATPKKVSELDRLRRLEGKLQSVTMLLMGKQTEPAGGGPNTCTHVVTPDFVVQQS